MNRRVVGLDLGGTFIKSVVRDDQGCGPLVSLATAAQDGPDGVIGRLHEAARIACARHGTSLDQILGIGVGSPGPLNIAEGVVLRSANLPGWEGVPLRDRLADLTGCRVSLTNDGNAAAFGEFCRGAGRGTTDMCMLTLGTGVGGGVIQHGALVHGHFGNAGELGHMIVLPGSGARCGCGQDGCLEAFASGTHLRERARRLGADSDVDVPDIIAAALRGDPTLGDLWAQCCKAIAIACVNLQHVLNPQRVILGGGISAAGDALLAPVRRALAELAWTLADDSPQVGLATLGDSAGAIGAAEWFLHLHGRQALPQ